MDFTTKKEKINIEYEILYNPNFDPKLEIQICYCNPVQNKFLEYDDYFESEPIDDYKINELGTNQLCLHETRISEWMSTTLTGLRQNHHF